MAALIKTKIYHLILRRGGPRTPSKTSDANLNCALFEKAPIPDCDVKIQQNRIKLVTRPDICLSFQVTKARSVIEKARLRNPQNAELWLKGIRIEWRENQEQAKALMARAIQECPSSGRLWAEAIFMENKPQVWPLTRSFQQLNRLSFVPLKGLLVFLVETTLLERQGL